MLEKETINKLAQNADDAYKAKGIIEMADGPVFKILIGALDKNALDKIPEKYQPAAKKLIEKIADKDYEAAGDKAGDLMADIIPTPFIDGTEMEDEFYDILLELVIGELTKVRDARKAKKNQ